MFNSVSLHFSNQHYCTEIRNDQMRCYDVTYKRAQPFTFTVKDHILVKPQTFKNNTFDSRLILFSLWSCHWGAGAEGVSLLNRQTKLSEWGGESDWVSEEYNSSSTSSTLKPMNHYTLWRSNLSMGYLLITSLLLHSAQTLKLWSVVPCKDTWHV